MIFNGKNGRNDIKDIKDIDNFELLDFKSNQRNSNDLLSIISEIISKICLDSIKLSLWKCKLEVDNNNGLLWIMPLFHLEDFYIVLKYTCKIKYQYNNGPISKVECHSKGIFCKRNFEPINVKSQNLIKIMNKFILKINRKLKYGFFRISPINGTIEFVNNANIMHNTICLFDKENFKSIIRLQLQTIKHAINYFGIRILVLGDLMSIKKLPKNDDNYNNQLISYENDVLNYLERTKKYFKQLNQDINASSLSEIEEELKLQINTGAIKTKIMLLVNPINTKTPFIQEKKLLKSGGFSNIYEAIITYKIIEQNNLGDLENKIKPNMREWKIIKEPKKINDTISNTKNISKLNLIDNNNSIRHHDPIKNEKKVLELLQEKTCGNIARYYRLQNSIEYPIIIEKYLHSSLNNFIQEHDHFSITLKIWFIIQILNGLIFLENNDIYHLDIKPGNVVLNKNLICKLIDFGESYIKNNTDINFRPGRTFPYCSPNILKENINYNSKMDVFSIGVMMCELIFNQKLFDYKKSNMELLENNYKKNSYKTKLNEKSMKTYGPKHIMKILRYIVLICIESDYDIQPNLIWLKILLKNNLSAIEKLY